MCFNEIGELYMYMFNCDFKQFFTKLYFVYTYNINL